MGGRFERHESMGYDWSNRISGGHLVNRDHSVGVAPKDGLDTVGAILREGSNFGALSEAPAEWAGRAAELVASTLRTTGLAPRVVAVDGRPVAVVAATAGRRVGRSLALVATVYQPVGERSAAMASGELASAENDLGTAGGWAWVAALALTARRRWAPDQDVHFHVGLHPAGAAPGTSSAAILGTGVGVDAAIAAAALAGEGLEIAIAAPGVLAGTLEVDGRVTHCGNRPASIRPGGPGDAVGVNALEKGMRVINSIRDLEDQWLMTKAHPRLAPASFTIGVTSFDATAGYPFPAYFPDRARIGLRVDYPPGESVASVEAAIEQHVGAAAALDPWLAAHPPRFEWRPVSPAMDMAPDHPFVTCVREVRSSALGGAGHGTGRVATAVGRTEGSFYCSAGIPTVLAGFGSRVVPPCVGEQVGSEHVAGLAELLDRTTEAWCGAARE